jgi:hypothetical protein
VRTFQTLAFVALICLTTSCGSGTGTGAISGKFLLSEHPKDVDALDSIDFQHDGNCIVDSGERTGIPGKFHFYSGGGLSIEVETGIHAKYTYNYQMLKYTLLLSKDTNPTLYYVRMPEGAHPQFAEITGIFHAHNDLGDSSGEITTNYKFRDHLHNLVPDEHVYYDVNIDGICSYSNGVVTYLPEHSNAPQQDKYLRDFIVRRDENGLWIVDPFHDTLLCESPATNLDLPPPPNGYRKIGEP